MKFSDNIERTYLEEVYVYRTEQEMESRDEYNSNLWNIQKANIEGKKEFHLYKTVVRDLRIGESFYNKAGNVEVSYRVN